MGRINTGISIDADVLKAVDEDAKRTAKQNGVRWSRSRQIEYELAASRGLLKTIKPYLPQPVTSGKQN